jgi:small subunit ribosomal protein S15
MAVTKELTKQLVVEHGHNENDSGRTEVQVAVITAHIASLTDHLKRFPKDNNSKRGLLRLVGKRRRLLRYLQNNDIERYRALIQKLSLRK